MTTEVQWQRQIVGAATRLGWRVNHVRKALDGTRGWRTTTTLIGWPDLFLFHPQRGGFYCAELKTNAGHVSAVQRQVIADLLAAGVPAGVWRPKDWDVIYPYLAGRAAPPFVAVDQSGVT